MENLLNRITSKPDIAFGKPVIRDTRMAVVFLMEHLAAGDSHEDILQAFPFFGKGRYFSLPAILPGRF